MLIAYDRSKLTLQQYHIRRKKYEIVVAKGRLKGNTRSIYILALYVSTRLTRREAEEMIATASQTIGQIKTVNNNPYLIVGGISMDTALVRSSTTTMTLRSITHTQPGVVHTWTC